MRSSLFLSIFFTVIIRASFGQTHKIDQLKKQIITAGDNDVKLGAMLGLLDEYESLPKDTVWNYAMHTKALANKLKNKQAFSLGIIAQANAYLRWDNIDSASALINTELSKYKKVDAANKSVYFKLMRLKIDCFGNASDYKGGMPVIYNLTNQAEMFKDSVVLAENYNTLAAWNYDMDFVPKSLNFSYKAISYLNTTPKFNSIAAVTYLNLGDTYWWLGKADSALYCINKSIVISQRIENLYYLSVALQKLASVYLIQKQYIKAEQSILLSLKLGEKIDGDEPQHDKIIVLASVYEKSGKVDKAIKVLKDGLKAEYAYKESSPHTKKGDNAKDLSMIFYLQQLAKCYQVKGDHKNYEATLEMIIDGKDAFYKANSAQAMAELETKYQVQKKETTIAQQKLALIKENYLFYGLFVFLILAGIIVWLIFKDIRRKQRIKLQQLRDEEKRLAAQAVNDAEEQERKRIAADLHDNLGAQLSFIKRNVNFIIDQPEGFSHADERKYLGYVNDIAQNAMIDLRETIWVLNKDAVNIQEFADKLKSYLRQQLLDKDGIKWDFTENITIDWQLSSGEVMHVFRIVQEVVSNIIKHAGANHIVIRLDSPEPQTYLLKIADNGKGFDLNSKYDGHYGLENIQQRAKEISAKLLVESKWGTGTKITLVKAENNTNALYTETGNASTFTK